MDNSIKVDGKKIRAVRERRGISKKEVADALNIDEELISVIENGKSFLPFNVVYLLSVLYDAEISDFTESNAPRKPVIVGKSGDPDAINTVNRIASNCDLIAQLMGL
jgi:transcriptional regulator with XRE-family HTH domain